MKLFKRIVFGLWLGCVLAIIVFLIINPKFLEAEELVDLMNNFESQLLAVYICISILRGLFLIPSTPFVLAGVLLFPTMPWAVLLISMGGILLTATGLYYFSDILGFSEKLEKKYPKKIDIWHQRLNSPKATLIVLAWSFFPLVPTDLICYVAGIVKMPYKFMIAGVLLGELVLVYFYVFLGMGIFEYIFQ